MRLARSIGKMRTKKSDTKACNQDTDSGRRECTDVTVMQSGTGPTPPGKRQAENRRYKKSKARKKVCNAIRLGPFPRGLPLIIGNSRLPTPPKPPLLAQRRALRWTPMPSGASNRHSQSQLQSYRQPPLFSTTKAFPSRSRQPLLTTKRP